MLDRLKPGQTIRCTVTNAPRSPAAIDTLERLMRREPRVRRGLRKAQNRRRRAMVVYNRGNRDWYRRESCARIVRVAPGASWTMDFTLDLAPEFRSVAKYLTVAPA